MKNTIKKIIDSLRQQFISPKVYALVLKAKGFQYLSVQAGYSLEEAFSKAKTAMTKEVGDRLEREDIESSKIDMFMHVSVEELFGAYVVEEKQIPVEQVTVEEKQKIVPLTLTQKKNLLMKRIIENKDLKLLEEHRSIFSATEVEYLTAKINKK